ncbi:glycosyltransferase family 2 protein [Rhodohalobacter sp. 8-1]|uniref:glycosyltransferase family 2 protein n=1 Tax=Rhodohalobacter sp. 8-1 TaxID=3131972 RepID=UPI0030EE5ACA
MVRKEGLVSVIIPCYNHGEFLEEAIDSILSQTYRDFEIIVVDDGSDNATTLALLKNLQKPKTTVYRKKNGGASSARNYGIEKSSGNYILTLDSDDRFAPSFLEKAVAILNQNPKAGMVTSWVKRFSETETSYARLEGGGIEDFIIRNHASASLLFRHSCWLDAGGYDEEIPGYEDWDFFIGVTKCGWRVESIPEYLFYYRLLEGSNYDQHLKISPDIIKYMAKKHKKVFQEYVVEVLYNKELVLNEFRNSLNTYKSSASLKIGNLILMPYRTLRNFRKN